MKYVLISIGFLGLYFAASIISILVFDSISWINRYSVILGLGMITCFCLNIAGTIIGFRNYKRDDTPKKEKIAAWLNLALVLLFVCTIIIPNIIDVYRAFN